MMGKRDKLLNLFFSVLAIVAVWVAWTVAYYAEGNDMVVPSVNGTFAEMGRLLAEAAFWRAFGNTMLRTLEAFLLSFALGLVLALFAVVLPFVRAFLSPIVSFLRTVPTMALVLILLLWTSRAAAPVVIALLVLFPVIYASMLASLDGVRAEYGEMARVFGVGKGRQALKMYLPLAAPPVLGQMGADFSLGLKITVSGEVLSLTARSLGNMMQETATLTMNAARLMALTLVTVFAGFLFEGLFWLLKKIAGRRAE